VTRIGIYSHETRTVELQRTVQSLRDAQLDVDHINLDTGVGSPIKNRLNAIATLKATFNGIDPVLILEDDVLAGRYVADWLEYLHYNVTHVVCMLPMKPEMYSESTEVALRNLRTRKPTPSRLELNPRLHHWWGSQAMWIPPRIAYDMLQDQRFYQTDHGIGPWDHAIRTFLMEFDEPLLMTFPAVFQHQSPPSVRQRKNRRQRLAAIFDPNAKPPAP